MDYSFGRESALECKISRKHVRGDSVHRKKGCYSVAYLLCHPKRHQPLSSSRDADGDADGKGGSAKVDRQNSELTKDQRFCERQIESIFGVKPQLTNQVISFFLYYLLSLSPARFGIRIRRELKISLRAVARLSRRRLDGHVRAFSWASRCIPNRQRPLSSTDRDDFFVSNISFIGGFMRNSS